MSVYLKDIPLGEAQTKLAQSLTEHGLYQRLGEEEIALTTGCVGRVLARPIWAKLSSPHYHASAMDGFAVKVSATIGASDRSPLQLSMGIDAIYVDTGDPIPNGYDGVIPIEIVEPLDELGEVDSYLRDSHTIRIRAAATPWQHVRPMGEDIVATELVLPEGHILRPVDLGAIAASGHTRCSVARRPSVAVIPTGSELVPIGKPPKAGEIIEYNALMMAAQIEQAGANAVQYPIVVDEFSMIRNAVTEAANDADLVLLNAGSSAGAEDFSASVVEALGDLLVHGVAVRPGHPVILGILKLDNGRRVPIVGVPGYPVSAALTIEIFVLPLISRWLGRVHELPEEIEATINTKVTSPAGDDDFIRVVTGWVGDRLLASPLSRGAGVITSLVRADGLALLPSGSQGIEAGAKVNILLYSRKSQLRKTIFSVGSHDLILDILAQEVAVHDRRLVSANVGSLAGLISLKRGNSHFAGAHLLDPETGDYNVSYLEKYLPEVPVEGITLVNRVQGLIVSPGNPKGISSLQDLVNIDVRFVNRQRGAGTRILLDYQLEQLNISSDDINGYQQEEYTHLSVAAAVASGRADCTFGIEAAAQALLMDFIPLYNERYDIIIPLAYLESDLIAPLLDILQLDAFREKVRSRAGYDVTPMGEIAFRRE